MQKQFYLRAEYTRLYTRKLSLCYVTIMQQYPRYAARYNIILTSDIIMTG